MRSVSVLVVACLVALLAGCATSRQPDPLEPLNRATFAFNEAADTAVLRPVATAYVDVVPSPVREGVGNFFANIDDAWSAINLFLQGRPVDGASDVARVGTNTVLGLLGIFDVATPLGLERHGEDLGQTLGHWGVDAGAYVVWPLLGPSSLRDSAGRLGAMMFAPRPFASDIATRNTLTAIDLIHTRAGLLPASALLDAGALDKYLFVRDAYLQRRRGLIEGAALPGGTVDAPDSEN